MAKKVFIGVGHGGKDPGAVGFIKEADVNLAEALACRDYLVARGVEVKMSREKDEDDDLNSECRECNAYNPDLAIDIHNNAGGGDGWEAWHSINGGVGKTLANYIEVEIEKIGQNSRGCKTREGSNGDYYGFIRMTNCPAVIVEGVFVDNKADAAQADTLAEQKAFGEAYARGILKTLGIADNPTPVTPAPSKPSTPVDTNPTSSEMYRVRKSWDDAKSQLGAYRVLDNAIETCNKNSGYKVFDSKGNVVYPKATTTSTTIFKSYLVKVNTASLNVRAGAGTDYAIKTTVKKGDVYTIVDEKMNGSTKWGKLKSGAGWISLGYCKKI